MDVVVFAKAFYNKLQQRLDDLRESVANGNAKDFEHYRHMTGEIQGILFGIETLKSLLERHEHGDDDEASR